MFKLISEVLSDCGFSTVSRCRRFLHYHEVLLNGDRILSAGKVINFFRDEICVDGKKIDFPRKKYILMNKPAGFVCSTKEESGHPPVFSIIGSGSEDLHTAGRLDANTEGLLILTNDGSFSHRLFSAQYHVSKTYRIILEKNVGEAEQMVWKEKCSAGFHIPPWGKEDGFDARPSVLEWLSADTCNLTITEGKFHQVKRMVMELGNRVAKLRRVGIGGLFLDETLIPGQWRFMTEEDFLLLGNGMNI